MNNHLQIFKSEIFGQMRTTKINDIPYICLADVCQILDIKNARQCKTRLNQDGVIITDGVDSLGRKNKMTFINESNLYKVIFQSRKPEAEQFTEWVTSEVLPSIRQTGGYITGQSNINNDELLSKTLYLMYNNMLELSNQFYELRKDYNELKKNIKEEKKTKKKKSLIRGNIQ